MDRASRRLGDSRARWAGPVGDWYSRARWAGPVDWVTSQSLRACYLVHGSVCTGGFELKQIFENNAEGTARVLNLISVTMSHCL